MLHRGVTTKFKFEYEVQVVKQVPTLVIKSIQCFRLSLCIKQEVKLRSPRLTLVYFIYRRVES